MLRVNVTDVLGPAFGYDALGQGLASVTLIYGAEGARDRIQTSSLVWNSGMWLVRNETTAAYAPLMDGLVTHAPDMPNLDVRVADGLTTVEIAEARLAEFLAKPPANELEAVMHNAFSPAGRHVSPFVAGLLRENTNLGFYSKIMLGNVVSYNQLTERMNTRESVASFAATGVFSLALCVAVGTATVTAIPFASLPVAVVGSASVVSGLVSYFMVSSIPEFSVAGISAFFGKLLFWASVKDTASQVIRPLMNVDGLIALGKSYKAHLTNCKDNPASCLLYQFDTRAKELQAELTHSIACNRRTLDWYTQCAWGEDTIQLTIDAVLEDASGTPVLRQMEYASASSTIVAALNCTNTRSVYEIINEVEAEYVTAHNRLAHINDAASAQIGTTGSSNASSAQIGTTGSSNASAAQIGTTGSSDAASAQNGTTGTSDAAAAQIGTTGSSNASAVIAPDAHLTGIGEIRSGYVETKAQTNKWIQAGDAANFIGWWTKAAVSSILSFGNDLPGNIHLYIRRCSDAWDTLQTRLGWQESSHAGRVGYIRDFVASIAFSEPLDVFGPIMYGIQAALVIMASYILRGLTRKVWGVCASATDTVWSYVKPKPPAQPQPQPLPTVRHPAMVSKDDGARTPQPWRKPQPRWRSTTSEFVPWVLPIVYALAQKR